MRVQRSQVPRSRSAPWFRVRDGLTLIEVLVVMAIVGILVGLLLLGIQSARESSRRVTCVNNLRQIGIALQSYVAAYQCYPAAAYAGSGQSPQYAILPQIERSDVTRRNEKMIEAAKPVVMIGNPIDEVIPLYQCPSDVATEVAKDHYPKANVLVYRFGLGSSRA